MTKPLFKAHLLAETNSKAVKGYRPPDTS